MKEFMYELPTALIVTVLFVSMAAIVELGYRIGRRMERSSSQAEKTHVGGIQAALLGVLALLLAFTLSLSLQRFDGRSVAIVDEANAIGTAYLRTQLLPDDAAAGARTLLREYTDKRLASGGIDLAHNDARHVVDARAAELVKQLWELAASTARREPSPATTGLFVQSVNELIDASGRREAGLNRHVPEIVLLLLYLTFLMTGGMVGLNAGLSGHRASTATYVMVLLIVMLVFIIIDLDRPRRGLIEVDQTPMIDLLKSMDAP